MKLIDLLCEKLEKKIGDEWMSKCGRQYRLNEGGLEMKTFSEGWVEIGLTYIDENLDEIKPKWAPDYNERYYCITSHNGQLVVKERTNIEHIIDSNNLKENNYFKTMEEADIMLCSFLKTLKYK